jgi:hypothetical protein
MYYSTRPKAQAEIQQATRKPGCVATSTGIDSAMLFPTIDRNARYKIVGLTMIEIEARVFAVDNLNELPG